MCTKTIEKNLENPKCFDFDTQRNIYTTAIPVLKFYGVSMFK